MTAPDPLTTNVMTGDELQRHMDADSRSGVFAVIQDHPAFSDHGEQADMITSCGEPPEDEPPPRTVEGLIQFLQRLAENDALLPGLVLLRAKFPTASLRELAPRIKIEKSRLSDLSNKLAQLEPSLVRSVFHNSTRMHEKQKARRQRESRRSVHPVD